VLASRGALLRFLERAFKGHADESLVGHSSALRTPADGFEQLAWQAERDRLVLALEFEAHNLTAGQIIFAQVGGLDKIFGFLGRPAFGRIVKTIKAARPPAVRLMARKRSSPAGLSLSGRITTGLANTLSTSANVIPGFWHFSRLP
jgi:hypothetical protein